MSLEFSFPKRLTGPPEKEPGLLPKKEQSDLALIQTHGLMAIQKNSQKFLQTKAGLV